MVYFRHYNCTYVLWVSWVAWHFVCTELIGHYFLLKIGVTGGLALGCRIREAMDALAMLLSTPVLVVLLVVLSLPYLYYR